MHPDGVAHRGNGELRVSTGADSGKVKRIAHTEAAINRRYGLQARAFGMVTMILSNVRRRDIERTALVLRPV